MDILLAKAAEAISMPLGTAIMYYLVRLIMYSAVAAAGIAIGIKLRKRKMSKEKAE